MFCAKHKTRQINSEVYFAELFINSPILINTNNYIIVFAEGKFIFLKISRRLEFKKNLKYNL